MNPDMDHHSEGGFKVYLSDVSGPFQRERRAKIYLSHTFDAYNR